MQPNPSDLTNVLLLRVLQHNDSFGGSDPLAPITNVSSSAVAAQSILFASLAVTLFAAFITILGRQWILNYKETSYWGMIVEEEKGYKPRFVGLQRWGLHFIMESLPFLLQLALLLFGIGLTVYFWHLEFSSAKVILAVTCIECVFYACTTMIATVRRDYPFQTPLSILLSKIWRKAKEIRRARFLAWLKQQNVGRTRREPIQGGLVEDDNHERRHTKLSNPASWRRKPIFTSPIPMDAFASAGHWMLDNPTNIPDAIAAAAAVAAQFPKLQWPSIRPSSESLLRLYAAYMSCFEAPSFDEPTRVKALQSAATYYVLYHTRLVWDASKSRWVQEEKLPHYLPPDLLLLHKEWNGRDVFRYLLHIKDRSAPGTSARYLSYIAPFWFCADFDSVTKSQSNRLNTLNELVNVLETSKELNRETIANCVLCVGGEMDLPLHPEDLIRVDKRYVPLLGALRVVLIRDRAYLVPTFQMVVEHIHNIILAGSRRSDHAVQALGILIFLVKQTRAPLIDPVWMNRLLKRVAEDKIADEHFTLFLRLGAGRKDSGDFIVGTGVGDFLYIQGFEADPQPLRRTTEPQAPTLDDILFSKIIKYIQDRVEQDGGWQDDGGAIFGGLLAIRDIRELEHPPFYDDVLQTLRDAMNDGNPSRVRQAAYDVMLVMQDHWLKSETLRQKLQDLDFFRQMYRTASIARPNPDYRRLFLKMTEALSEDVGWHPYLREVMHIWLPLRHDGQDHTLRILVNVGALSLPTLDGPNSPPFDEFLQKLVVDEWAAVPGRQVHGLTADRLEPLAEITLGFKELFDDDHRREVLAVVEQVIPGLERRHGSEYEGPGDDVRGIVDNLVTELGLQPERVQPEWPQPEWLQPGGLPSGELQPGELQPGELQPGELQPGELQPGELQPGELQSGGLPPGWTQPEWLQPEGLQPGRFPPEGLPSQRFLPGGSLDGGFLLGGPPTRHRSTYD